jgi:transcriptional regulator with XRE-family HTH domain
MDIKQKFGKRVRTLRKEQWRSQEKFAQYVGLHRTYIGVVERGEKNISLENIEKIANALDEDIKNLFDFTEKEVK